MMNQKLHNNSLHMYMYLHTTWTLLQQGAGRVSYPVYSRANDPYCNLQQNRLRNDLWMFRKYSCFLRGLCLNMVLAAEKCAFARTGQRQTTICSVNAAEVRSHFADKLLAI